MGLIIINYIVQFWQVFVHLLWYYAFVPYSLRPVVTPTQTLFTYLGYIVYEQPPSDWLICC
jgi:hypothetical protein